MKAKYRDIDEQLYQWLLEQRESGHRVSGKRLKREALRLHSENGDQLFKASNGWLRRWRKRHNVRQLRPSIFHESWKIKSLFQAPDHRISPTLQL